MPVRDRSNRRFVRLGVIRLGFRAFKCKKCGQHVQWEGKERQRCSCGEMSTGLLVNGRPNNRAIFAKQADRFLLHDAPEIAEFYAKKGIDAVRELDILLPFREIDRNFDAWYQVWAGGILTCQGDGQYVQYATPMTCEEKNGEMHVYNAPGETLVSNGTAQTSFDWNSEHFDAGDLVPCPGAAKGLYPHCAACDLGAILKVMMADPELFRYGYYQIHTGSGRNHDTVMGVLEGLPIDRLNGYPFKLRLVEEQTTFFDKRDEKRKKTNKWFLQLEPDPTITRELYRRQLGNMLGPGATGEYLVVPGGTEHLVIPARIDSDWDPIDADEPAPPPYAEVQSPDEAVIVDADAEPVEEEAAGPPIEAIAPPTDLDRGNFVVQAVDLPGYGSVGAVKTAMLAIFGSTWEKDSWNPAGAWQALQDHKRAA